MSVGKPFKKMGMKSSPTGKVFFDDVRVPAENLLGAGMRDRDHVRKSLAGERIGIAVMGYGIAERCFEIARDYAKERVQGGHAIANYQLVQNRPARDAKLLELGGGTTEIQILTIARHILASRRPAVPGPPPASLDAPSPG